MQHMAGMFSISHLSYAIIGIALAVECPMIPSSDQKQSKDPIVVTKEGHESTVTVSPNASIYTISLSLSLFRCLLLAVKII